MLKEKKIVTYKYVYGSLKTSRYLKLEEDYLFFIQLKTYTTSSLFLKGSYLKELSAQFKLSECSISTKMNSLIRSNFATKVLDKKGKHISYQLKSFYQIYTEIFKLDDELLKTRTVKLKSDKWMTKKELKEFLDMTEVLHLGQKVINKDIKDNGGLRTRKLTKKDIQSTEMVPCKDFSERPNTLIHNIFEVSLIAIGKTLGKKSEAYALKIINKLVRLGLLTKRQNRQVVLPENSLDQFEMIHSPGKRHYSKKYNLYFQQKMNSYSFIFNLRFFKHKLMHENSFKILKQTLLTTFNCYNSLSMNIISR